MTPLAKRFPRELRRNVGKYLGIFLLMCGSIALTSGFLLAAHSIGCLIDDMRDDYTIEDGRVTTSFEATDEQLKAAEDAAGDVGGVTLYKNFSIDAIIKKTAGDDGTKRTLRTYAHRTKVDIASYCEGRQPKADDEVAIDRVFATNNDLAIGDKVELEGRTYTICGIMTQPDSQALFLNNSDFTVNTITYGVAEVTDAGFAALEDAGGAPAYTYSFTFADRGLSTADRIDAEQDMVEALTDADARVDDLIDADSNQGIGYACDDVDGDSMMWMTLLDIIIVIMAFVFVVLTDATIEEESAIIGTLLASGYRSRDRAALPGTSCHRGRGRGAFGHRTRRCVLYRAHARSLLRLVQPAALPGVLELGDLREVCRGSRRRTHSHHAGGPASQDGQDAVAVPSSRGER